MPEALGHIITPLSVILSKYSAKNEIQCQERNTLPKNKYLASALEKRHFDYTRMDFIWKSVLIKLYLTIRLRARDFYETIVDENEARINYHFIEIESE